MVQKIKNSLFFIIILWIIWAVSLVFPMDLKNFGIIPRSIIGIRGIFLSPFLHKDLTHLISNTVPLFILLTVLYIFYARISKRVVIFSIILGNSLVWLFARKAVHIGASGLIYSLAGFLIASGFFRKSFKLLLVSIIIILLYGGMIYGIFPTQKAISWEGHLFGAIAGVFLAYFYNKKQGINYSKNINY